MLIDGEFLYDILLYRVLLLYNICNIIYSNVYITLKPKAKMYFLI